VRWIHDMLRRTLWAMQAHIAEAVLQYPRVAVRSCHGIGKTALAASLALWFLFSHNPSIVITTAPTFRQVEKLIWRELRMQYKGVPTPGLGGNLLKTELNLDENWYAMGLNSDEPEQIQGFHSLNVFVIVDEASGVSEKMIEAINGLMATGQFVRILYIGNPTRPAGEFYEAFHRFSGLYHTIHVSAFDTPNLAPVKDEFDAAQTKAEKLAILRAAPLIVPYLTNPSWVADMMERYGEDSQVWQVRVEGDFPSEAPDQLVPLHLIEAAENRWDKLADTDRWWYEKNEARLPVELGCDIARYGDSETVFCPRSGDIEAPLEIRMKQDTMETSGQVITQGRRLKAQVIRIDADGLGAGVFDRLKELQIPGIQEFHGGHKANDPEMFYNRRSECYWALRQRYEDGAIAVQRDPVKSAQLSTIKYKTTSRGQTAIETKEEMRARGVASPDRADAEMMAFSSALKKREPGILI